jgi:hypothetical protein
MAKDTSTNESDHQDLFKKYFESRFEPLAEPKPEFSSPVEDPESEKDDGGSEESEWEGLSENTPQSPAVQVVVHSKHTMAESDDLTLSEYRSFMASFNSCRPLCGC